MPNTDNINSSDHFKRFSKTVLSGMMPVFLIILIGTLVYSNTFNNSFHFDDNFYVIENPVIRDFGSPHNIWAYNKMRFLPLWTLAFNYRLGGFGVFGYHLFNLVVHILAAIFVYLLSRTIFETPGMKGLEISGCSPGLSFFIAVIFLTHPVQVQSVTYICQRITSLSGMFYLGSLFAYAKGRMLLLKEEKPVGRSVLFLFLSIVLGACAVFSKEIAVTLVLTVVLYETLFLRGAKSRGFKYAGFFAGAVLLIAVFVIFSTGSGISDFSSILEGRSRTVGPMDYLFTQFRVIVTYIRLLFLPVNQSIDYDYAILSRFSDPRVLASMFFVSAVFLTGIFCRKKYRLISFGILWFFIVIAPQSSFIAAPDVIFEHRLYLAVFGYALVLVSGLWYFVKNRNKLLSILVSLTVIYSALTFSRNFVWKDEFTLWNDAAKRSSNKPRIYNNRATGQFLRGRYIDAIGDYTKAIALNPLYEIAYIGRAKAFIAIGAVDKALMDLDKIIAITPETDQAYSFVMKKAFYYRSMANMLKKSYNKALDDISKAINFEDFNVSYYMLQADILKRKGDLKGSLIAYDSAIGVDDSYYEAHLDKGNVLILLNKPAEALKEYEAAGRIDPAEALVYKNSAVAYFLLGDHENSWRNVALAEEHGGKVDPGFLAELRKVSPQRASTKGSGR